MTTYRAGDVVLIPFPFTDLTTFKQRPAVVLSSSRFNRASNDVVIAAITSRIESSRARYNYRLTPAEQKAAGLPKPSIVKLGKIVALDQRLIRKRIGAISRGTVDRIMEEFQKIFSESL